MSKEKQKMEGCAEVKYIRMSPRKLRDVTELVKGKNVNEVLGILAVLRRRGAVIVGKAVKSAVASVQEKAKQEKQTVDIDTFSLMSATVNQGPVLKRFRPRAMGRATPIRKRSSHLHIVIGAGKSG